MALGIVYSLHETSLRQKVTSTPGPRGGDGPFSFISTFGRMFVHVHCSRCIVLCFNNLSTSSAPWSARVPLFWISMTQNNGVCGYNGLMNIEIGNKGFL